MSANIPHLSDRFNDARRLCEPPARLPLPAHIEYSQSMNVRDDFRETVISGLAAWGLRPGDIERINIAWPRKHPATGHLNKADNEALVLRSLLRREFPHISFNLASSLYETVHLDRSSLRDPVHTLTMHQIHAVDPALQADPLPFLAHHGGDGEYFILADWYIDMGTTMADLASFITHNGGRIAAVFSGGDCTRLRPWHGTPVLGERLAVSGAACSMDYTPERWSALFNAAIAPHGRTLETLTAGEAHYLFYSRCARNESWLPGIMDGLGWDRARCDAFARGP
jgi:hypothetical protein